MSVAALLCCAVLGNPLPVPPRGWSTWTAFECSINATLVNESIAALAGNARLREAGYNQLWIDDCWGACEEYGSGGKCVRPTPRSADGNMVIDPVKFPDGFKGLTDLAHARGLQIGIYTSVSAITCGGYQGSLHYEAQDAAQFVAWGFDMVKHDTCDIDCGVHDGCIQNATRRMRNGLYEAGGGRVVYALDHGNPVSPQRAYNPHNRAVTNKEALVKVATKASEISWVWVHQMQAEDPPGVAKGPHMTKHWFDRRDSFESMMTNTHLAARTAEYQSCGAFNHPDYLTTGAGGMTDTQYRMEFYIYAVLASPLLLGNDIRKMSDASVDLVTNANILAINADPDCTQGSLTRSLGSIDVWVKTLSTSEFAVVVANKGTAEDLVELPLRGQSENVLFPVELSAYHVTDVPTGAPVVRFSTEKTFKVRVPSMDAVMLRFTPVKISAGRAEL